MQRCLDLAKLGKGYTKTNPLVGCVIVNEGGIIGEGFHQKYGEAHAEVNAFNNVADKSLISNATVYVSLEPCSFEGKTPACTQLFHQNPCKKIVIGALDPNPKVSGNGVKELQSLGIKTKVGVLERECKELIKPFLYSIKNKQPYTIAKWAESGDGFIGLADKRTKISNSLIDTKTQLWRSQIDAFLIGHNTLKTDNPLLNSRILHKKQPLRCVIGNNISNEGPFFELPSPILLFGEGNQEANNISINKTNDPAKILDFLYSINVGQIIIEGGTYTIEEFLQKGLVQEIRRIINPEMKLKTGIKAPQINDFHLEKTENYGAQIIEYWSK